MKKHWTKNNKTILKAIREDSHPVSLLALELRRLKPMTLNASIKKARTLIERAIKTLQ